MSVTTFVLSCLKVSLGSRIAPRKSARSARYSRTYRRVVLIKREMRRHHGDDPTRLQRIDRLREEIIMQRETLAMMIEPDIGKGYIADHRIDPVRRKLRIPEVLNANVVLRVDGPS